MKRIEILQRFVEYLAIEGNIKVLVLQTLVSQFGFGMFYVIWQPYILAIGMSVIQLGIVQSVINLSTAIGLIAWGILSDRFGRKPIILASNASRIVAMVALVVSRSFIFLLVFAFFIGFSSLFMQMNPARSALTSESVSVRKRATAFSVLLAVSQITNMLTASAGGYLAVTLGYYPIFYICIIGDAVGLISMVIFLEETLKKDQKSEQLGTGALSSFTNYMVPESDLLVPYSIMVLAGLGYGTGYSLFYGTLVETYSFNPIQLGLMSTLFSLVWGVSSIPFGRLSDRFG